MGWAFYREAMATIEINEQFQIAFKLIENSKQNLLILGKAGTGKSTFLDFCCNRTTKKMAVLAPTGVAAINIGGATIHSFFGFSIDITLEKIKALPKYNKRCKLLGQLDTIVIDEISMVRADLLDCVAKFLTLNGPYPLEPFGGIQMIFIGDLYQIPPVVKNDVATFFTTFYQSPYFFSAKSYITHASSFTLIEFEKIYRQTDISFVSLLNAVRNNTVTNVHLMELNKRYQPSFKVKENEFWIYITGTNKAVKRINDIMLHRLEDQEKVYQARITGETRQEYFPTDTELKLKVGAQIMMVNNDQSGRWNNGTLGRIIDIEHEQENDLIVVQLANKEVVQVTPNSWDIFQYGIDEETNSLRTIKVGDFTQYPMRLAWALTVHKSQGKTFTNVILDLATTFSPGQMYVALSRCTSLGGLVLKKPITAESIFIDQRIVKFLDMLKQEPTGSISEITTG